MMFIGILAVATGISFLFMSQAVVCNGFAVATDTYTMPKGSLTTIASVNTPQCSTSIPYSFYYLWAPATFVGIVIFFAGLFYFGEDTLNQREIRGLISLDEPKRPTILANLRGID